MMVSSNIQYGMGGSSYTVGIDFFEKLVMIKDFQRTESTFFCCLIHSNTDLCEPVN